MDRETLSIVRKKIFISHATPNDNDFTKWLSFKLLALGYTVWCDILFLDKGVDFWKTIENEIRTQTCRFLVVLSEISNVSEGVLNEIAVAGKVKKELEDEGFIIPLLVDERLSYDRINIELNRLNAIDFTKSWIKGLNELIQSFIDNKIPKNIDNANYSNELYKTIFLLGRNVLLKDETYNSNWFSILSLPQYLFFHAIGPDDYELFDKVFPFPTFKHKNYICTFSEDIDYKFPDGDLFDKNAVIKISTIDIMRGNSYSDFVENVECKKFLVRLLNNGFIKMMENKQLKPYSFSNRRKGFWFELNQLEKNKINGELFVGEIKGKNWHFGISGFAKLVPYPILILSSHIFFTSNGRDLILSKARQSQLRKKQGKNWWNNKWNEKLINIVKYLASDNGAIKIPVGTKENIMVSSTSMKFTGHYSYTNPKEGIHEEDLLDLDIDIDSEGDLE